MHGHIDVLNNVIKVWLCGRRDSREIGCVLLCKCVPVLTLDVLHIAENPKYVGRLTNLSKSRLFLGCTHRSRQILPLASAQVDRTGATA